MYPAKSVGPRTMSTGFFLAINVVTWSAVSMRFVVHAFLGTKPHHILLYYINPNPAEIFNKFVFDPIFDADFNESFWLLYFLEKFLQVFLVEKTQMDPFCPDFQYFEIRKKPKQLELNGPFFLYTNSVI